MQTGTVNRFNKIKGYGFITPDTAEEEVFVHFSEIQLSGYKELKEGQRIRYIANAGEKGQYATQVEIIQDENAPTTDLDQ
ncbi:MAG: cold-shock protein [Legionellales bacterium]